MELTDSMEVSELLLQFSEIAVAFTGFSGVVAALGRNITWDEKAVFRFQNLLSISISTVFLALIPLGMLTYEIAPSIVWLISSMMMIALTLVFFFLRSPIARRLSEDDLTTRSVGLTFLSGTVVVLVTQVLGLIGIWDNSAVYFTGLLIYLFLSALQFAVLSMGAIKNE